MHYLLIRDTSIVLGVRACTPSYINRTVGAYPCYHCLSSPPHSRSFTVYDLSSYLKAGEGNLDSDANIGKLALALEVDAALAYNAAFSQLSDRDLLTAASTIGPVEACHATAIRAVFRTLIPTVEFVPTSFISAETRQEWILKV